MTGNFSDCVPLLIEGKSSSFFCPRLILQRGSQGLFQGKTNILMYQGVQHLPGAQPFQGRGSNC